MMVLLSSVAGWGQSVVYPTHKLGLSLDGCFSNLLFDRSSAEANGAKAMLGGGAGAAFQYELEYRHLLFQTGIGVEYTIDRNRIAAPDYETEIQEYSTMLYRYTFNKYQESTRHGSIYIPVLIGGKWESFYFLCGARVAFLNIAAQTTPSANVTIWATDDDIIDPLYGLYTHEMGTKDIRGAITQAPLNNLNVMVGGELGGILLNNTKTEIRLAAFAYYGLTNSLSYKANAVPYKSGDDFSETGGLVGFNKVSDLQPYSIYGYRPFENTALHSLNAGIKLTVLWKLPSTQGYNKCHL